MGRELQIDLERLRGRKLCIATPMYGGMATSGFITSMLRLQNMRDTYGLPYVFQALVNESLIPRARDTLAAKFLASDCTELMFIDADIEFNPEDVIALQHFDKEVIGGAYPKKAINWAAVKAAVVGNPAITPEQLALAGQSWASHMFKGDYTLEALEPVEAKDIATGFMLIKREVFEKLAGSCDTFQPPDDDPDRTPRKDYFTAGVHDGWYESEDYSFCRRWQELGGKVWLCPWMVLNHQGFYNFPGGMLEGASATGVLN